MSIVNYRYQANKPALFVVVSDFLDHLRSTFSPDSKISYDQLFEKVKTAPLLVLDDFGEQTTTHWVKGLWAFFKDAQEKVAKRAQKAKSLLSRR